MVELFNFSATELQCYVRVDASPRPGGDARGTSSTCAEFRGLIFDQAGGSGTISSLLAKNKPPIVVEKSGGQLQSKVFAFTRGLIISQLGRSVSEELDSRKSRSLHPLASSRQLPYTRQMVMTFTLPRLPPLWPRTTRDIRGSRGTRGEPPTTERN